MLVPSRSIQPNITKISHKKKTPSWNRNVSKNYNLLLHNQQYNTFTSSSEKHNAKLSAVRGMRDIFPQEHRVFNFIQNTALNVAQRYNFQQISTPIVEYRDLFERGLGSGADVVHKEMYTFEDRSGDAIVLRPENTASVVRALLSHKLTNSLPHKWIYTGPMFRYERPQRGRHRQFHQIGVEHIGEDHPHADAELMAMASHFLTEIGISKRDYKISINSLGSNEDRERYHRYLTEFFEQRRNMLSSDSIDRLNRGSVLRIFDSKEKQDQQICAEASSILDYLSFDSLLKFDNTLQALDAWNIPYEVNKNLVRGLDYYSHTVFEFIWDPQPKGKDSKRLGASQRALLAGGRYDGLVTTMGGPSTPAIGWAAGIERLQLLMDESCIPDMSPLIHVVVIRPSNVTLSSHLKIIHPRESSDNDGDSSTMTDQEVSLEGLRLCSMLRESGFRVEYCYEDAVGKQMKRANKSGASICVLIGEDEINGGIVSIKDMRTGEQSSTSRSDLVYRLKELLDQ
eukprot:gb/GECH01010513.1/.p1 GENE.gb/GECH01010513.1/~~gb/GECH01010513.1/.p1  ORF type:complete len:512 (+),score=120.33 gb/GECH01010513.1/:1-1536(+)